MCTWVAPFALSNELLIIYQKNVFTHVYTYDYKFNWLISYALWRSCREACLNMCTASNLANIDLKVIMKWEHMHQRWGSQVITPSNQEQFDFFFFVKTLQWDGKPNEMYAVFGTILMGHIWKNCHLVAATVFHQGPIMALIFWVTL